MDHQRLPMIPEDLLKALEAHFPDRMPEHGVTLEQVNYRQGQVSVVRFLRAVFEEQNDNILSPGAAYVQSP